MKSYICIEADGQRGSSAGEDTTRNPFANLCACPNERTHDGKLQAYLSPEGIYVVSINRVFCGPQSSHFTSPIGEFVAYAKSTELGTKRWNRKSSSLMAYFIDIILTLDSSDGAVVPDAGV